MTLGPGVYKFDSSAQLTGTLILDGKGSTNPTFIFQMGSTITTASNSSVLLINGAGSIVSLFVTPRMKRNPISTAATIARTLFLSGPIRGIRVIRGSQFGG